MSFIGKIKITKVCFGKINIFGHTISNQSIFPIDVISDSRKMMVVSIESEIFCENAKVKKEYENIPNI